jgi:hypothetical protein
MTTFYGSSQQIPMHKPWCVGRTIFRSLARVFQQQLYANRFPSNANTAQEKMEQERKRLDLERAEIEQKAHEMVRQFEQQRVEMAQQLEAERALAIQVPA